ncbi:Vacuolar sorting-associated protein 62 [Senna tora]|uniref:Vacuolar sorting-associated protein 62 n=1 Tax=Senna tora TaxID=362788 RepID=A0A834TMU2_9FABA|nr:Vacuolar sorting-associated protein 62 [Senna tora]
MFGGTFTDIAMWVFYPFNGPARAKVEFINVPLGKIGEHVGDWEHVTLRVSNFNGQLWRIYFAEHSGGTWVEASELEFQNDSNKPIAYSSLHGHAMYPKPGLVVQGSSGVGIRNDTAKSNTAVDLGLGFEIVSAEYLGGGIVVEPPWVNYFRQWGPKLSYDIAEEISKAEKMLPGRLKSAFEKIIKGLPNEVLGEEGPTGPKVKRSWNGDEV